MYKVLVDNNIDALLVDKGHIDICGWDYGFIGGASGMIANNKLAFCGDLSMHPDYEKIVNFSLFHDAECISLSNRRLMDFGSLILV